MAAYVTRPHTSLLLLLGLWLAAAPAVSVRAETTEPKNGYALSAWTAETGFTAGEILAMTQDLDGYLWLGTTTGLVRFDGTQFVTWGGRGEPPIPGGLSVAALSASRDGSLWLGFANPGGVIRIKDGTVTDYTQKPGAPSEGVTALLSDRQGTVWAGSRRGLHKFVNEAWVMIGPDQGFAGDDVYSIYEDRSGALWFGSTSGVYRGGDGGFHLTDRTATNVQSFAEDDAGHIWVTDTHNIFRRLD